MAGGASVRALYDYTYEYEGTKISFTKNEQFQLIAKSNKDWWQVRRYVDGSAQDIYVPAVYVKEVKAEVKKNEGLYQNIDDVRKQMEELNALEKSNGDHNAKLAAPPVVSRKPANKPTAPVTKPKLSSKKSIDEETENSPSALAIIERLQRASTKKQSETAPSKSPKPRSRSINTEASQTRELPSPTAEGNLSSSFKMPPPPTKPKSQKPSRPKSMLVSSPSQEDPEPQPQVKVNAVAHALEAVFANRQVNPEPNVPKRTPSGPKRGSVDSIISGNGEKSGKALNLRKTPSPKTSSSNLPFTAQTNKTEEAPVTPNIPVSPHVLPSDWTEHKTSSGHTFFYNSSTGQSSWTRPNDTVNTAESTKSQLEKRPPRGWTRQINPITSTPIYTNSRNGERWSVASDGAGNFYYYNMANPSLTVGELPALAEVPSPPSIHTTPTRAAAVPQENIYDSLLPETQSSAITTPTPQPESRGGLASSTAVGTALGMFANSLSGSMTKHGYLQKKKLYDPQGKKTKGNWQRLYAMLQQNGLVFYTDHKVKDVPGAKPLSTFSLVHCTVSPCVKDKDKKKNAFQVSSPFGEQFLLQAETASLMNNWYSIIQTTIDSANQEYKEHPERFKDLLPEADGEHSPKLKTKGKRLLGRSASNADEFIVVDDENDPMFMELSADDKSARVKTRLKKLMAKRPQAEQLRKKGILEDPVFGSELHSLCEREGTNVPRFLVKFIEHIEKKGLDVVGIYRLSGNAAFVNKLRYQVDQGENINLDDQDWSDINIVTGCLKLYLRELPDPIIPFKMFRSFIDAARASSQSQRVANIAARVMELPSTNYYTLRTLIQHFKRVVEYGHINKMQASNVAIVFGPTLMRAEMDSMEMAILMPVQNGIVEAMINDYDSIFRK